MKIKHKRVPENKETRWRGVLGLGVEARQRDYGSTDVVLLDVLSLVQAEKLENYLDREP